MTARVQDFTAAPDLIGERITLTQLRHEHAHDLALAAEGLAESWVTKVPTPEGIPAEIDLRLGKQAAGEIAAFTIMSAGRPVGMTTYLNLDADNRRLEIGSTWLARKSQGTHVNPEAKLLLLTRAFEELDCIAVEFRTHFHNFQSRAAIAKLGAKQDGILRSHQLFNGVLRDTVVFSITAAEWPTVRLGLRKRLERIGLDHTTADAAGAAAPGSAPADTHESASDHGDED